MYRRPFLYQGLNQTNVHVGSAIQSSGLLKTKTIIWATLKMQVQSPYSIRLYSDRFLGIYIVDTKDCLATLCTTRIIRLAMWQGIHVGAPSVHIGWTPVVGSPSRFSANHRGAIPQGPAMGAAAASSQLKLASKSSMTWGIRVDDLDVFPFNDQRWTFHTHSGALSLYSSI